VNYGQQNLNEGILAVVGAIVSDAQKVRQFRIESAIKKADADVRMQHANFTLKVSRGEISPDDFEGAWTDYEGSLKDYSDTYEFAPAREAVAANIADGLPEMKLKLGLALNQSQLQRVDADFTASLEAIANTPGYDAAARKRETLSLIDGTRGVNPIRLDSERRSAQTRFLYDSALEQAHAMGLSKAMDSIMAGEDSPEFGSLPINVRQAAAAQLQAELEGNGVQLLKNVQAFLNDSGDQLIADPSKMVESIATWQTSDAKKTEALAKFQAHQDEALYTYFERAYNDRQGSASGLAGLYQELLREGNLKGLEEEEYWIGSKQQGRREDLLKKIESRLGALEKEAGGGTSADAPAVLKTKARQVQRDVYAGRIDWFTGRQMIKLIAKEGGDTVVNEIGEIDKEMLSYVPENAKYSWANLESTIASDPGVGSKDKGRLGIIKADIQTQVMDYFKKNPNASKADYDRVIQDQIALWTGESMKAIREMQWEDGTGSSSFDAKMVQVGAALQSGALDAGVGISAEGKLSLAAPVGNQVRWNLDWQKKTALARYGIAGLTEVVSETGNTTLRDGKGGTYYYTFNGKDGTYDLFKANGEDELSDDGSGTVTGRHDKKLTVLGGKTPEQERTDKAGEEKKAITDAVSALVGSTMPATFLDDWKTMLPKVEDAARRGLVTKEELAALGIDLATSTARVKGFMVNWKTGAVSAIKAPMTGRGK